MSALRDFTFRKVLLHGYWDHAHTIFIGPRVHDGAKGCHVVTPLRRRDGTTVLVDRGFITQEFADPALWTDPKIQTGDKEVTLFGMLRTNQTRNNFTPDNKPERGEWYWVDVDALAKQAGGEAAGVQPVYVEQIFGARPVFIFACANLTSLLTNFRGSFRRRADSTLSWNSYWKSTLDRTEESTCDICRDLVIGSCLCFALFT